jgi:predicted nucleic acid-binding protein
MIFIDTTVLVAGSTASDNRHEACIDLLAMADARGGACAIHSLAEVFAVLSARPLPLRMPPSDAARVVAHTAKRFKLISLTSKEYLDAIHSLADFGHSGGMIYDALLLACARKAKANRIYTLNPRHFRVVAPDLAARIVEP